jgi:hypothetical protein
MESTEYLFTELEIGDKVYVHNVFQTYTYNGESIILVDASIPRILRLPRTVGNTRKSVYVKDISGLAHQGGLVIELIGNESGVPVTLQSSSTRAFTLVADYGTVWLSANEGEWTIMAPHVTSVSNLAFRLPQNLNFLLPPTLGVVPQVFPAITISPRIFSGSNSVPIGYNGLSLSSGASGAVTVLDPSSGLTIF